MSYTALYREWRPKTFEDVIGQEHIVKTIRNQIISGRIPHAYLFCGTRGTGKTSTAKILSKAVNCLNLQDGQPCNECEMCKEINQGTLIDVIEIDAASNNRVENIRELIEDVKYPPHRSRYKVYIVDEVHMLSTSAFNALLKTLEEPPSFVIFILATTDPQKVPPTILSRCQRFDFKRIKTEDINGRLRSITNKNGILVEDRTLSIISRISDGAMRDALSILDQAMSMSEGKIEYNDVINMLGLASNEHIFNLADAIIESDVQKAMKIIDEVILNGKDVVLFTKEIIKHFRNLLMVKISKNPDELIDLSEDTIRLLKEQSRKIRSEEIMRAINIAVQAEENVKNTSQPRILIEMAVIKLCKKEYDTSPEMILSRLNSLEEKINSGEIPINISKVKDLKSENIEKAPIQGKAHNEIKLRQQESDFTDELSADLSIDEIRGVWNDVLNLLKANKKMSVYAYLQPGDVKDVKGNYIYIVFDKEYSFCKENLEKVENRQLVEEYFTKVINKKIKIGFIINDNKNDIDESIQKAKELFGENIIEIN
ncbi:DNA polymerase III subunit gamma/tau [Fervidicella metallireducens AeB]|uniref:DNA-directed DNA polymerase n=1 Tax=Fervidicella metallireducens AeB TaxID=1403537 RepID=A0A017RVY7_9CLOT|nr:DNA polymerase III subunit gamma/tau [Fervidicella metallireducens]EYE88050.1 DNA polymerase III subunit gamma/tau [Fervidicella metallireducens AeB]